MQSEAAAAKPSRWILPIWMRMTLFVLLIVPICIAGVVFESILLIAFVPVISIAVLTTADRVYRSKHRGQFAD
jgi:hypothetical protein